MNWAAAIFGLVPLCPIPVSALSLEFPAQATVAAEHSTPNDSYFLPTGPFNDGSVKGTTIEGALQQTAWTVGAGGLTTLQILRPLRDQLNSAGFAVLFECEAKTCGGFDFRYRMQVLPEPDMHINLGDYRYLAALRTAGDEEEYVGLIVSRSANSGFVQLTHVGTPDQTAVVTTSTKAPTTVSLATGTVGEQLELSGHATLDDLFFKTGSSQLGDQEFVSLKGLAAYLSSRPDRQVVLVGHTDSKGRLDTNVALSKRRASAVVKRLIDAHGVRPDQVAANGVGYLAPRASNLTDDGRAQNRRVEVILTSTQ